MSLEVAEQPVDDRALANVHGLLVDPLPQAGLEEDRGELLVRVLAGSVQAAQEPFHPRGDFETASLTGFELAVVLLAPSLDRRRHAVVAFRGAVRS